MKDEDGKMDEQTLIVRCKSGDREAFAELVKRHYKQAISLAIYWTGNRELALDISQEAFLRIYRNLDNLNPENPFAAWMYTVVKNLCLNYFNRQKSRWRVFSDVLFNSTHTEIENFGGQVENLGESNTEQADDQRMLRSALQKLEETDREIIILKDLHNYTYKEIGEMLQIPAGTVMSRLYHARKKLSTILLEEEKYG